MAANAREGFYNGGKTPFGYKLEMVEKRGTKSKNKLAIDPDEAAIVKLIFELCQNGLGIKAIVTKLNNEGIRNREGKEWYVSSLGRLLTSPTYAGRHPFKPTHWRTGKLSHRSEWIDIPCPVIIAEAEFQNVQRLLRERDPRMTPPRFTTSNVLLGRIARCGSCGGTLINATGTSRNQTVHHYYKCSSKLRKGNCPGGKPISIARDQLDELVIRKVTDELLTEQRVGEIVARAVESQANQQETASSRVALLKRQLAAAKRKENNLWELAADLGVKAKFGFLGKLDEVQEEAAGLERQILAQESLLARAIRPLSASEAAEKAAAMRRLMLGADIQKKRQFVQAVIQKVIVKDDEIEIVGHDSTVAESACDLRISKAPPVRGFEREWCRLGDSNT